MMKPFQFLTAQQPPAAQPVTGPMGINKFFTPGAPAGTPPAAPPPEAGGGAPDPQAVAAVMGDPKLIAETPFGSSYAEGLISSAMRPQTSGNALEGVGRLAQLASGYYHKSKDDARENERAQATLEMLKKSDPELAMVFAGADSKTRAAIMQQYVGDKVASRREARQEQRADARQERIWAREDQRQEQQWKREDERKAADAQRAIDLTTKKSEAEFKAKKDQIRQAYPQLSDEDASRLAAGITPKVMIEKGHIIQIDPVTQQVTTQRISGGGEPGVLSVQRDPQTGAPIIPGVKPEVAQSFVPNQHVNVTDTLPREHPARDKAFEEAAKEHSKRAAELRATNDTAGRMEQRMAVLAGALQNAPEGGPLANPLNMARQILNQVGLLPMDEVTRMSSQEIVQAFNTLLAPTAKEGLPGAVSNFEMQAFLAALPGMLQSKDGSKKLIEAYTWMANRTKAREQISQDWIKLRGAHNMDGFFGTGFESYTRERMLQVSEQMPMPAWMQPNKDGNAGAGGSGGKSRVQLYEERRAREAEREKAATAPQGGGVPTIRNPQTGEIRELRNGEWVPKQ